jgi:hypothetical protein
VKIWSEIGRRSFWWIATIFGAEDLVGEGNVPYKNVLKLGITRVHVK